MGVSAPELLAELLPRLECEEDLEFSGSAKAYLWRNASNIRRVSQCYLAVRTAIDAGCILGGLPKFTT
jgi:hypothetical protein